LRSVRVLNESAQEIYNELLAMNPSDNQGIRLRVAELSGQTALAM
jgi:hypothetical protein